MPVRRAEGSRSCPCRACRETVACLSLRPKSVCLCVGHVRVRRPPVLVSWRDLLPILFGLLTHHTTRISFLPFTSFFFFVLWSCRPSTDRVRHVARVKALTRAVHVVLLFCRSRVRPVKADQTRSFFLVCVLLKITVEEIQGGGGGYVAHIHQSSLPENVGCSNYCNHGSKSEREIGKNSQNSTLMPCR
ncbi:hypothetical protein B0T19DRAFT_50106 [Cercophora scortea]|uniref:Uncharacterized protein n=1 Tax=Cercophora scortea TaxID=314031 RepID=A0AAE0J4E2_9PEZI|nr:hypothetical protein B0T19DRAFT_50106 [Cercophora scortea]